MSKKTINMLEGSIGDKILLFALPLAATGILQQLFNAVDIAVVGQFVGKHAMAAVGSNSPVIALLVNGFVGISIGANVVISMFTGQKNEEKISESVHTAVLFSLIGGVGISALGELVAPYILTIMSVPDEVFPMALEYLRVYLLGMPVIFLYNFESAIFRSQGDTRTPLICLAASGVLNVGLNLFFVCVVGMATAGVATATVLANLFSSTLLFILLKRRKDYIRLTPKKLRLHKAVLKRMVRIGLPAGLQSMVFSLSNICIQSAVNSLGPDVMAASAAAFNIEIFAFYLINSFGQACTTFIGQNYGARNIPRCRRVTRTALVIGLLFTAALSAGIIIFGRELLALFNGDPAIADIGIVRLRFILSAEVICAVIEIMSGAMRGYGSSLTPALMSFFGVCGVRIVWVYTIFRMSSTFTTLMLAYPLSWIVTATALVIAYLLFMRRFKERNKLTEEGEPLTEEGGPAPSVAKEDTETL